MPKVKPVGVVNPTESQILNVAENSDILKSNKYELYSPPTAPTATTTATTAITSESLTETTPINLTPPATTSVATPQNQVLDIALSLREAQVYGLGVKDVGAGVFDVSYGVHFDINTPSSYIFFADLNDNLIYEDGVDGIVESGTLDIGYESQGAEPRDIMYEIFSDDGNVREVGNWHLEQPSKAEGQKPSAFAF